MSRLSSLLLILGFLAFHNSEATAETRSTTSISDQISQAPIFPNGLRWVGSIPPSEKESALLLSGIQSNEATNWIQNLESFVAQFAGSPWTPSLRSYLGGIYYQRGQYSLALKHWERGWEATKGFEQGAGKEVADSILAPWCSLLASLGRVEKLRALFDEAKNRTFENPQLQLLYQRALEGQSVMLVSPETSYRCGTFALFHVADFLACDRAALRGLRDVPSPTNGFSLADLARIAKERSLDLVPAYRPSDRREIPLPCVVHWREKHYAAILRREGELYYVIDPTFGHPRWMSPSAINSEASGFFMASRTNIPPAWRTPTAIEMTDIRGKGQPNNINDWKDKGCNKSPYGPLSLNGGGNQAHCITCPDSGKGMPDWSISEPYINLWLSDEPLSYSTSRGESLSFRWTYEQRADFPLPVLGAVPPKVWGTSPNMTNCVWHHNWHSYIRFRDPSWDSTIPHSFGLPAYDQVEAFVYGADGGVSVYEIAPGTPTPTDSGSRIKIEKLGLFPNQFFPPSCQGGRGPDGTITNTDCANGFRLTYADGSQDIYNSVSFDLLGNFSNSSYGQAFLTFRIDPFGNTNQVVYEARTITNQLGQTFPLTRIKAVVDYDNRTNSFIYVSDANTSGNFGHVPIQIQDPYGRSAQFQYDSRVRLTNMTDAAGLSSLVRYGDEANFQTNNRITRLITPYGTNIFTYFEVSGYDPANPSLDQGNLGGHNRLNRAILVSEPNGASQLFAYRYETQTYVPDYYGSSVVPTVTSATFDNGTATSAGGRASLRFRDSFYWGRSQMAQLPAYSGGALDTYFSSLTATHYKLSRLRHWLDSDGTDTVSDRISLERDFSPDGTTDGQLTWYDYSGKIDAMRVGDDSLVNIVAFVLPDGRTSYEKYTYYSAGYPAALVGRPSQVDHNYDKSDGSVGVRNVQYTYSTSTGDLLRETYSDARTNFYTYNSTHQITTFINTGNETNTFVYGGADNQITLAYWANGEVTDYTYNYGSLSADFHNSHMLTRVHDAVAARSVLFNYSNGLPRLITNVLGMTITNYFDGLDRPTQTQFPDGTFSSNRYDRLDLSARRDRSGKWTYLNHDSVRRLTNANNEAGQVLKVAYGDCGCDVAQSVANALNQTNSVTRDFAQRPVRVDFADGSWVTNQIDLLGRITTATDAAGRSISYAYNLQGLLKSVSSPQGNSLNIVYDDGDRPLRVTRSDGSTVTNSFDSLDRLVRQLNPNGQTNAFVFNLNGLAFFTNGIGKLTRFTHDSAFRRVGLTNANSEITKFDFNEADQVKSWTDGNNHTWQWVYDAEGRPLRKLNASSQVVLTNGFDPNGRVVARWTAQKGLTRFSYDAAGHLTNVVYPTIGNATFNYDAAGRLRAMSNYLGLTTFDYTPLGRLQIEDGPWSDDAINYLYDQGNRTNLSVGLSGGGTWQQGYLYDTGRRLTRIISPAGQFNYGYADAGGYASPLIRKVTLPSGAYITNAYDSGGWLTNTTLNSSTDITLNFHGYGHDLAGQRTNQTRTLIGGGLTPSESLGYTYDNVGQLVIATGFDTNGASLVAERNGYVYDAAGNLLRRTNDALIQTFGTDANNRLTSVTRSGTIHVLGNTSPFSTNVTVNSLAATVDTNAATFAREGISLADGANTFTVIAQDYLGRKGTNVTTANYPATVSYSYDSDGNLTGDGQGQFAYDDNDRLVEVSVASQWRVQFAYDPLGRRRVTTNFVWSGSAWQSTNEIRYLYDGAVIVQERFFDPGQSTPRLTVTYTRGLDLSGTLRGAGGIGGLLAMSQQPNGGSQTNFFYHADASGNVTAMIDAGQQIVAQYQYDPFGNLLRQTGSQADANRIRFSGKEREAVSALVLFEYRAYDPKLQRWVNGDPLGEAGGMNLYAFVLNGPVGSIDSDGQAPQLRSVSAPIAFVTPFPSWDPQLVVTGPSSGDYSGDINFGWDLRNRNPIDLNNPGAMLNTLWLSLELFNYELGETLLAMDEPPPEDMTYGMVPDLGFGGFGRVRCPKQNKVARNFYKNHKEAAKTSWEQRTGKEWPKDSNGKDWPGHHDPSLKSGGDPMHVEPQNPSAPDPHNIPGPDGLTDYQKWGALGPKARGK